VAESGAGKHFMVLENNDVPKKVVQLLKFSLLTTVSKVTVQYTPVGKNEYVER
jgi:hypothetical protein